MQGNVVIKKGHLRLRRKAFTVAIYLIVGHFLDLNAAAYDLEDRMTLILQEPLSQVERKAIRRENIKHLTIDDGADPALFDEPGLFPALRQVTFRATDNARNLTGLARNYPNIQNLIFSSPSTITSDELRLLSQFKSLKGLSFFAKIDEHASVADLIPRSVEYLSLTQPVVLTYLPKLKVLKIDNCRLGSDFFIRLIAPNLSELSLGGTYIETAALKKLDKFPRLNSVDISTASWEHESDAHDVESRYRVKEHHQGAVHPEILSPK